MNLTKALTLAVCLAFGTAMANAGTISYTCDPSVSATTCNYLNTTVAGNYSSTFTNGLWRNYRIEEVASPHAWHRDPRLVWTKRCPPTPFDFDQVHSVVAL